MAILWDKVVDKLITVIPDGNERIQCVEFKDSLSKPILIICVYLPTGGASMDDEFMECFTQLEEILQKYSGSHEVLIGGDLNIDLTKSKGSKKKTYLMDFLKDFDLRATFNDQTYINPQGKDCSEIDYFVHTDFSERQISKKTVLKEMEMNLSDHYPISINILSSTTIKNIKLKGEACGASCTTRINWTKVDKEKYAGIVTKELKHISSLRKESNYDIETVTETICNTLVNAAKRCYPHKKKNKNKPKLKVWNSDISSASQRIEKHIHCKLWRQAGKPNDPENPVCARRKESKKMFRSCCRIEIAKRFIKHKEDIMEAKCYDSRTFHKLVKQNRGSGSTIINDLNVNEQCFSGEENVIDGFKSHFESLATIKEDPDYDEEFKSLTDYDYADYDETAVSLWN